MVQCPIWVPSPLLHSPLLSHLLPLRLHHLQMPTRRPRDPILLFRQIISRLLNPPPDRNPPRLPETSVRLLSFICAGGTDLIRSRLPSNSTIFSFNVATIGSSARRILAKRFQHRPIPNRNRNQHLARVINLDNNKKSTVPIYKKGDLTDFSNFRPISLLPTIYKIFSGVISSCIMAITTRLGWMSPEQKGFLPSVRGIQQEPTHILQAVIEESKRKRRDMVIAWLDLSNAFGSAPHPILNSLFQSLHWHYIHRARLGILPIKWKP